MSRDRKEEKKRCEKLWRRNKYLVLSKSQKIYLEIRNYLKKDQVEVEYLLKKIQEARGLPENRREVINALSHIWGYFKREATEEEKEIFFSLLDRYEKAEIEKESLISYIKILLEKYPNDYINNSTLIKGDEV